MPGFSPRRPELPPRPRLCEQGPCRHYHRLETQVESADPGARRVPVKLPLLPVGAQAVDGGTLYQAPAMFHTAVSHYCYPGVGIEIVLGDVPVVSCSRWDPSQPPEVAQLAMSRSAFLRGPDGRQYTAALEAWEGARASEAREAEEAEELIASSLIDAQMERYAFTASGPEAHVIGGTHGDPITADKYSATCDLFPARYYSVGDTEAQAIARMKAYVAHELRKRYRDGEPFPEPPAKDTE